MTTNLVVVAHPDDEILGFGGAGAVCVKNGEIVQPVILSGGVDARTHRPTDAELFDDMINANQTLGFEKPILGSFPNIRMNTISHLDLVQFIEAQIETFQPDRIFTHYPADLNNDHTQVANACLAAARLFQRKQGLKPLQSVYFIEILSSTDWAFPVDGTSFQAQVFVDITSTLDQKIKALSCYRNVMRPAPHPRSDEVSRGHAAYRGGQCGCRYAEAFQLAFRSGF